MLLGKRTNTKFPITGYSSEFEENKIFRASFLRGVVGQLNTFPSVTKNF